MTSKLEYIIVHLLIVAGVITMTWGPLVYMVRTVHMHQGGVI